MTQLSMMKRYRSIASNVGVLTLLVGACAGSWAGGCSDGNDSSDTTSASVQSGPYCGDGKLDNGEECDDGDKNADSAVCMSTCKKAKCGDGIVSSDIEECDNGGYNADTAACTAWCNIAYCGDHFIQQGVEECDDGDKNGTNAPCTLTCKTGM